MPKQRLSHERAAFNTNPKMETIDEPAARILNQKETRSSPQSPKIHKGPKIIKLKKKQKRTVIRQEMQPSDPYATQNFDKSEKMSQENSPERDGTDLYDRPIMMDQ